MSASAYARLVERAGGDGSSSTDRSGAELVRRNVRWRKHALQTDADAVRQAHVDYLPPGLT